MLAPATKSDLDLQHYVLVTEPGKEFKAERHLRAAGWEPWVPSEKVTLIRSVRTFMGTQRRKVDVTRPIFRGYVLLPANMAWSFGPLYSTPGLRQSPFLMICGKPAVLQPDDVEKLRGAEQDLKTAPIQGLRYQIGEHVRIVDGPFTQFTAEITQLDDASRIELLMEMLGAKRKIRVTAEQIEPLD